MVGGVCKPIHVQVVTGVAELYINQ